MPSWVLHCEWGPVASGQASTQHYRVAGGGWVRAGPGGAASRIPHSWVQSVAGTTTTNPSPAQSGWEHKQFLISCTTLTGVFSTHTYRRFSYRYREQHNTNHGKEGRLLALPAQGDHGGQWWRGEKCSNTAGRYSLAEKWYALCIMWKMFLSVHVWRVCGRLWANESRLLPEESGFRWRRGLCYKWKVNFPEPINVVMSLPAGANRHSGHSRPGGLCSYQR